MSSQAIALGAAVVLGIGVAAFTVLWWRYGGAGPGVELDAIRTASAITVAAGGAAALLLAARRQRSTELTLKHESENATEQRITELYTRAVDQLGNEKAPVRLGGLHALERLAQSNPLQRQTIVDVICAYLRMPYTPLDVLHAPDEDAPPDAHARYKQQREELQVRLTAQRILTIHLRPGAEATFWANIDLNLNDAYLHSFNLAEGRVRTAQFKGAQFVGQQAGFGKVQFDGNVSFDLAKFDAIAWFGDAEFGGLAGFRETEFGWDAGFIGAQFTGYAWFLLAKFNMDAWFSGARFTGEASFYDVRFTGHALFDGEHFTGDARFDFNAARARPPREVDHSWPTGWTTRDAADDEEEGWLYLVPAEGQEPQANPPSLIVPPEGG